MVCTVNIKKDSDNRVIAVFLQFSFAFQKLWAILLVHSKRQSAIVFM